MNQNVKKLLCCDAAIAATETWGRLGDLNLPRDAERQLNTRMNAAADVYLAEWKAATAELLEDLDDAS